MRRIAVIAVVLGALAAPALAHAAPTIQRPDPVTYPLRLDYEQPLSAPDGGVATLAPLDEQVIGAAMSDAAYLHYTLTGDLGGFLPAPVGQTFQDSGGHPVLATGEHKAQIPLFSTAAGGLVSSFTFTGRTPSGPTPPPDNGNGKVLPPVPPTPGNIAPPANQGFGGQGANGNQGQADGGSGATTTSGGTGGGGGGGGTTTKPKPPPTTTAPGTTTTTTTGSTTTTGGGGSGGGGGCSGGTCSPGSCGAPGLSIVSNLPGCTISLTNAAPGISAVETMTIENTSGSTYTLSIQAVRENPSNHLWTDLVMDVYAPPASAVPTPISGWLSAAHSLTTLNPGDTVTYVIELFLPTTAGNADLNKSAVVGFTWNAQG